MRSPLELLFEYDRTDILTNMPICRNVQTAQPAQAYRLNHIKHHHDENIEYGADET